MTNTNAKTMTAESALKAAELAFDAYIDAMCADDLIAAYAHEAAHDEYAAIYRAAKGVR